MKPIRVGAWLYTICYGYLFQLEQALTFKQKALALWLELLGDKHPDIALSYNNIGITYVALWQLEQALTFKQKALALNLELMGPEHPDTVLSLNNTIITFVKLNQFTKANDTLYQFKKALPVKHQHKQKLDDLQLYINQQSSEAGFRATSRKPGVKKKPRKKNKRK